MSEDQPTVETDIPDSELTAQQHVLVKKKTESTWLPDREKLHGGTI
jgi:hypothetical protein